MPANIEISRKTFFSILAVLLVVLVSLLFRLDTIYLWELAPQDFLVDDEPVLINLDGYYYLNAAQEIQEKNYSPIETNRAYPDTIARSSIPPLLSVLLAQLSSLTAISLNWLGNFMPAVLGVFIAVPIYLLSLKFGGGNLMAVISCTSALMAPLYANRTGLGSLDTDCLNVTLALCCCYFFMQFSTLETEKRYYHLGLGFVTYIIFLLWWDQAPSAVAVLSLFPLALGLILVAFESRKLAVKTALLSILAVICINFLIKKQSVVQLVKQAVGSLLYISKQETDLYPNIGSTITEQAPFDIAELISATTVDTTAFVISILGLLWLFFSKRKQGIFILPIAVVGLFSVLFSMRFAIFLSPVLAIGIGFFFANLYKTFPQKYIVPVIALCFTALIGWKIFDNGITKSPKFSGQVIAGMKSIQSLTPEGAVIWSWWNEGHPLVYWSQRNTINDGMIHGGQRTSYTALPLQTDSFRLAANFMQFYAAHGQKGIQSFLDSCQAINADGLQLIRSILSAGPENLSHFTKQLPSLKNPDWSSFFYPSGVPPIYLFLDKDTALSAPWIYWYGSWNPRNLSGDPATPMVHITDIMVTEDRKAESPHFTIDYSMGEITLPSMFDKTIELIKITTTFDSNSNSLIFANSYNTDVNVPPVPAYSHQDGLFEKMLANEGRYEFDVSVKNQYAVLQDQKIANSVLNRLFWRANEYDKNYFEPIVLKTPLYQIWKVSGDKATD